MDQNIIKFLDWYPYEIRKLLILTGIISLCKETGFTSFGDIVKITGMQHKHFIELMEYLLDDDSFESKLTGELYAEILKLRMWYEEYLTETGQMKKDPDQDPMNDLFGRIMGG